MPSLVHDALVSLFLSRPQLAGELLLAAGLLPPGSSLEARVLSADLSQVSSTALHADGVVLLLGEGLAVVLEVQLQPDEEKRYTWPLYLAALRQQQRCEVALLVLTLNERTARWAAGVVSEGLLAGVPSLVVGPQQIPRVTDLEQAVQNPNLAVLSAMAHGHSDAAQQIGVAAWRAALELDEHKSKLYVHLILSSLSESARRALEGVMLDLTTIPTPDVDRIYAIIEARGEALALAKATQRQQTLLLRLVTQRFGDPPSWVRAQVEQADQAQLERWIEALFQADSLQAVFT